MYNKICAKFIFIVKIIDCQIKVKIVSKTKIMSNGRTEKISLKKGEMSFQSEFDKIGSTDAYVRMYQLE